MVKQAGIGTSTSQIIARRLSLGGVRSAANTFAIFGSGAISAQQTGEGNFYQAGVAGFNYAWFINTKNSKLFI